MKRLESLGKKAVFASLCGLSGLFTANAFADGDRPQASCPSNYRIFGTTDCVAEDGTIFVFMKGGWFKKSIAPGGVIVEDVLTGKRQYADPAGFSHFVPLHCVWTVAPYPTYFHGTRVETIEGDIHKQWDCNNGKFYYAGAVSYRRNYVPQSYRESETERRNRSGVGAQGTIGRGTEGF